MKYVLIDTNCWIDILNEPNERNLRALEYWTKQGVLTVLTPAQLLKEWERQQQIQFKIIVKAQTQVLPKLKAFKSLVKLEHNFIEERIKRINQMLYSGRIIKPSNAVLSDVMKRQSNGRAPFHHNNNKSHSDALIFLTSVDFIRKTKQNNFIFITGDIDDFSDSDNPEVLNKDFNFANIEIAYFINLGKAINELENELGDVPSIISRQKGEFIPLFYLLPNQHDYSLVDKLYFSLKKYQDQISFIPKDIIVRIFPFKIENEKYDYSYHSPFQINSNNKELVEIFRLAENFNKNVNDQSDGENSLHKKGNKGKINEVKQILNENLIFSINYIDNSLETQINAKPSKKCNCVLCCYNKLDFLSSYSKLSLIPLKDERETMKHAYVHFQFGNFILALKLFYHVYIESDRQKKYIRAFICLYNAKRLIRYVKGYFIKVDVETQHIIDQLEKITFEDYKLSASADLFVKENIEWIQNNEFYNTAFQKIINVVNKIRDHYCIQLEGGVVLIVITKIF